MKTKTKASAFDLLVLTACMFLANGACTNAMGQVLSSSWDRGAFVDRNGNVGSWRATSGSSGGSGWTNLGGTAIGVSYGSEGSGASYILVLRHDGTVSTLGGSNYGQTNIPSNLTHVTSVAAGDYHALALRDDGTVRAWGHNGNGRVSGASSVTGASAIAAGGYHSLALLDNGTVTAWGNDNYGQVAGASSVADAVAIAAGESHSLTLNANGTVTAWGRNTEGQVSGSNAITGAVAIDAGRFHSIALRSDGSVAAWGHDSLGQVSAANTISDAVFVSAGSWHNLAIKSDGSIAAWGRYANVHQNQNLELPTSAQWASATDGDYLHSNKWAQKIPSTALSDAVFDQAGTYTVGFGNDARARNLNVSSGNVTFAQNGNVYTVENSVSVTDGGTLTTDGSLNIGHRIDVGNGSFVQSQGEVSSGIVSVGDLAGTTGSYALGPGTLNIESNGTLTVGAGGVGTFQLDGGTLNALNGQVIVADGFSSDGSHFQMDAGVVETADLIVGGDESGTFTQTGGDVFADELNIAGDFLSTSTYSLEGGRLVAEEVTFGDGNGTLEVIGGDFVADVVNIDGGTLIHDYGPSGQRGSVDIGTLNSTATPFEWFGGELKVDTLNGDLNMMGGTLAPGNSPGLTTINGDYLISGGLLDMELAGLAPVTEHDFLDVNGDWTITGGDLQISLLGGFLPMAGNSFDLFDFNSLTGTFDNIFLPTLGSGLTWNTSALYSTGTLSVKAATVPEPSTWALMATVCGAGVWRQRRKRRASVSSSSSR